MVLNSLTTEAVFYLFFTEASPSGAAAAAAAQCHAPPCSNAWSLRVPGEVR